MKHKKNGKVPLASKMLIAVFFLSITWFAACMGKNDTATGGENMQTITVDTSGIDLTDSQKIMYAMQETNRSVADSVLPVVVEINVIEVIKQQVPNQRFSPFDFFFRQNPFGNQNDDNNKDNTQPNEREFQKQGLGSGVIVKQNGNTYYVVTNNHVVGNASEISLRLHDGREFEAIVVGTDARTDLAMISFTSKEKVPVAVLGDSSDLRVGDFVFAVGNPYGFESTVTSGIVSAVGRHVDPASTIANYTDYIQTDAAINPGNSGGALVNLAGHLIGINTWIASGNGGGNVGIGFAIPVNNIKRAINDFIDKGKIEYGWLGVLISDKGEQQVKDTLDALGIKEMKGAFVLHVVNGSPADKGDVMPGDLMTRVNGEAVKDADQLTKMVGSIPPGESRTLTVIRNGREMELAIKFEARDNEETLRGNSDIWPGFSALEITDDIRKELDLDKSVTGVLIGSVTENSAAFSGGLKQLDVIVELNGKSVKNIADFYKALNSARGREYIFKVNRGGKIFTIGFSR
ncbi:MAG: Do family serine endopeptidase [Spirochaetales bacterium]|nr:Do family serine endopeptidase [Spirochaetales bacterium]